MIGVRRIRTKTFLSRKVYRNVGILANMNKSLKEALQYGKQGHEESSTFLDSLEWRRSVKSYAKKDPCSFDITPVLNAIRQAPSSFGLQPFKIYVVVNEETKVAIHGQAYNQRQVIEASHLLIFSVFTEANETAERYVCATSLDETNSVYAGFLRETFRNNNLANGTSFTSWATAQAYIALGFALAACAELRIGSCALEGFNSKAVGELLHIPPNEKICVILTIGQPAVDQSIAFPFPKFRFPVSAMFVFEKKKNDDKGAPQQQEGHAAISYATDADNDNDHNNRNNNSSSERGAGGGAGGVASSSSKTDTEENIEAVDGAAITALNISNVTTNGEMRMLKPPNSGGLFSGIKNESDIIAPGSSSMIEISRNDEEAAGQRR